MEYVFDDIYVGMQYSFNQLVTKDMIERFSDLTGDYHPFHTDEKFALENQCTSIIAHGMLLSSFSSALVGMWLPGRNMMLLTQSFDYLKPVYPDTLITIIGKVKRKIESMKILIIEVTISNLSMVTVSSGEIKVKMLK